MQQNKVETEDTWVDPDCHVEGYQADIEKWVITTFGKVDSKQRFFRFGEEAFELLQAGGVTTQELIILMNQVYSKEVGDKFNEVGGVFTTLTSVCVAENISLQDAANVEKARCWQRVEEIRAKDKKKPLNSPLMIEVEPELPDEIIEMAYAHGQVDQMAKELKMPIENIRPIGPESRNSWPSTYKENGEWVIETHLPINSYAREFCLYHEAAHVKLRHDVETGNVLDMEYEATMFALTTIYGGLHNQYVPTRVLRLALESIEPLEVSQLYSASRFVEIINLVKELRDLIAKRENV